MIDGSQIYVSLNVMMANGLDYEDAEIIAEITRRFSTLRGMQVIVFNIPGVWSKDMIYLTRFAAETGHVCRTISHEFIHTVVDHLDGIKASVALDKETNGLSLLDRLMCDGYLGGE